MTHTIVEIEDFSYTYPDAPAPSLCGISASIEHGECLCITGPSGCGKTTFLLAIAGLLKGGCSRGLLSFPGMQVRPAIGMVFQNAESQILSTTVEDEVAFGPSNLNIPAAELNERVKKALSDTGLSGYEMRNVEALSAGEKHRLTIASVLSMEPSLLIMDEPTAQLDDPGKKTLIMIIEKLKEQGYTIAVADHNINTYKTLADRFVFMNKGRINATEKAQTCNLTVLYDNSNHQGQGSERSAEINNNSPLNMWKDCDRQSFTENVISLKEVCISNSDCNPVLDNLTMYVKKGELVHIFGENGAGKSTLFKCIVGLNSPQSGRIDVLGMVSPKPEQLRWRVGLLLQNPTRQLFEDTVYNEVSFSNRKRGMSENEVYKRTTDALKICDAFHLRDCSPFALSFGEQHRVALASVISAAPDILLLDEPFSGLDFKQRYRFLNMLKDFRKYCAGSVVIASHDSLPDKGWADYSFILKGGKIEEI